MCCPQQLGTCLSAPPWKPHCASPHNYSSICLSRILSFAQSHIHWIRWFIASEAGPLSLGINPEVQSGKDNIRCLHCGLVGTHRAQPGTHWRSHRLFPGCSAIAREHCSTMFCGHGPAQTGVLSWFRAGPRGCMLSTPTAGGQVCFMDVFSQLLHSLGGPGFTQGSGIQSPPPHHVCCCHYLDQRLSAQLSDKGRKCEDGVTTQPLGAENRLCRGTAAPRGGEGSVRRKVLSKTCWSRRHPE